MKTQNKRDIKQGNQNREDENHKTKSEKIKKGSDKQSVMAEMKIRSGRTNKKK